MNRRQFIAAATGLPLMAAPLVRPLAAGRWDRVLVLVELAGGNDGLNTIIPYDDSDYYRLRPALAVPRDHVLKLGRGLGFNPRLEPLMPLWRAGELALALGLGYPEPNLSHFRSIEIWNTASDSNQFLEEGALSRLFVEERPDTDVDGIVVGKGIAGPLQGSAIRAVRIRDPAKFVKQGIRELVLPEATGRSALAHVQRVQNRLRRTAVRMESKDVAAAEAGAAFPESDLGTKLETAARLLAAGVSVPAIKMTLKGFDTHANQPAEHPVLLGELGTALAAFAAAMKAQGRWDRVLVMTYAEFGRRAPENGSLGTDHGMAAPHFIMGGRVRGGFYGSQPPLDDLAGGNLVHRLHFRSLYATAAREWWGLKAPFIEERPLGCIA